MRAKFLLLGLITCLMAAPVRADTRYVSLAGTNNSPYINWADAATNIQWAVDVANANDTVLVSNGTYYLTNQVSITKGITVQSVNGRTNTFIDGNYPLYSNRCVYITHSNAVLDGFTVANGCFLYFSAPAAAGGGGIYVTNGLVRNCTITSNQAGTESAFQGGGGGVFMGPAGILSNCTISLNLVTNNNGTGNNGGGGVWMDGGGLIVSCVITGNTMVTNGNINMMGGGVNMSVGGTVRDSDILNNAAAFSGGLHFNQSGVASNCTIRGNKLNGTAAMSGAYGAAVTIYVKGTLTRCVISESTNDPWSARGTTVYLNTGGGNVDNCVVSNNYGLGILIANGGAASYISNSIICLNKSLGVEIGAGTGYLRNSLMYGNSDRNVYIEFCTKGYVENCTILNGLAGGLSAHTSVGTLNVASCIIYSNATYDIRTYVAGTETNFNFCCAGSTNNLTNTVGNITNNPLFASHATSDFRLTRDSPCINTGLNQDWMAGTVDLDRRRRIDKFSGQVDMGCYEHVFNGIVFEVR